MKNNYFIYNTKAILRSLLPCFLLPKKREKILQIMKSRADLEYIKSRLNFYNRLEGFIPLNIEARELKTLRFCKKNSVYFFDTFEYARFYPQDLKAHFAFGDVNYFLPYPSITKSRPIVDIEHSHSGNHSLDSPHAAQTYNAPKTAFFDYRNSVLLKLDKIRHFTFINDPVPFKSKIDKLFYRGGIYQDHRIKFF